jgi:hypothetical protein
LGKAFARVVLNNLQQLTDRVYPESQCRFRAKRSTIDMIFSIRQLQEKCHEHICPLYLAFIDLTKAFDLVSRTRLFTLLPRIGCPQTPKDDHVISKTKMRVYQACLLSMLLHDSESWTLYSHQERRLNAFHMRKLRGLLV